MSPGNLFFLYRFDFSLGFGVSSLTKTADNVFPFRIHDSELSAVGVLNFNRGLIMVQRDFITLQLLGNTRQVIIQFTRSGIRTGLAATNGSERI